MKMSMQSGECLAQACALSVISNDGVEIQE